VSEVNVFATLWIFSQNFS